jgi:hypothetical protein
MKDWKLNWEDFKENQPYKNEPFNKRNWGHPNHSICSFFGKLKPSITHFLVKTFTNENDNVFDCFSGSGTVPFESALNNRNSFAIDINPISVVITSAKIGILNRNIITSELQNLKEYIEKETVETSLLKKANEFGFNKKLKEYYHHDTLNEIILAREYFKKNRNNTSDQNLIIACLLHILHGNRPYALSRNSHPITPYAPTGDYIYKNLIEKLSEKLFKSLLQYESSVIKPGKIYENDILKEWPSDIQNLNAIITSPPFFDSTKYYLTNWLRSWFLGWEFEDFEKEKNYFIDTIQKSTFSPYDKILKKCKERLDKNGVVVFHLWKNEKKDMAKAIIPYAKRIF